MRSKPLLKPVVEALERQMEINKALLEHINTLRIELGLNTIDPQSLHDIIDNQPGDARPNRVVIQTNTPKDTNVGSTPIAPDVHNPEPTKDTASVGDTGKTRKYCENIEKFTDTMFGCVSNYLNDTAAEYVFACNGDAGEFYLNPAFSVELMKPNRRHEWKDSHVTIIEGETIPDLEDGKRYAIDISKPGRVELIEDYWIIKEPMQVKIYLVQDKES